MTLPIVFGILIALVLWDFFVESAGSPEVPTDCAEEDVPIFETEDVPAPKDITWFIDKDGRLRARKK